MNDKEIVAGFLRRDESAIEEARRRYDKYCTSIALNILKDSRDAEECVNDVFLSAWNNIPPNEPECLKTYLGKLVRNRAIGRYRTNSAKKRGGSSTSEPIEELAVLSEFIDPEKAVQGKEIAKLISDYLETLGETERKVFVRRYWYCDSTDGISKAYGIGKSRVKMMLKRTRDGLAGFLKKEGYTV